MRRKNATEIHEESLSISERIGVTITNIVGTLWTAVFFALLTLVSLPAVIAAHSAILWVSWVTQTFLQLVLLPVIIVGQNVSQKHSEALAQAMFEADVDAEHRITDVQERLDKIESEKLDKILNIISSLKNLQKKAVKLMK